jgi:predicted AAA+ superfamily ATPase
MIAGCFLAGPPICCEGRPVDSCCPDQPTFALLSKVSETLAGRAVYLTLYPFTAAERAGLGAVGQWEKVLIDLSQFEAHTRPLGMRDRWSCEPAFLPSPWTETLQRAWLDGNVRTYLERDLQANSSIENLIDSEADLATRWA